MPFLLLRWFVRLVSIAHLQVTTTAALDTVIAVLQLSGLLLLGYFHLLTVPAAYLVMGAACAVACLGWFLTKQQPLRFDRAHVRGLAAQLGLRQMGTGQQPRRLDGRVPHPLGRHGGTG